MNLKEQIEKDLKSAMLSGDKTLVTTLRGLKSAILYAEVAEGSREQGLSDDKIVSLLQKESKKRQESADLYKQGNRPDREAAELVEKEVIAKYLPAQMTEEQIETLVEGIINEQAVSGMQAMGQVIGAVKAKAGASADGALVAKIVKEKLS